MPITDPNALYLLHVLNEASERARYAKECGEGSRADYQQAERTYCEVLYQVVLAS